MAFLGAIPIDSVSDESMRDSARVLTVSGKNKQPLIVEPPELKDVCVSITGNRDRSGLVEIDDGERQPTVDPGGDGKVKAIGRKSEASVFRPLEKGFDRDLACVGTGRQANQPRPAC